MLQLPDVDNDIDSEDDEQLEDETKCPVSNSGAAHMLELCLSWLECQPEATVHYTTILRGLHAIAAKKPMDTIKQTKITKFFH